MNHTNHTEMAQGLGPTAAPPEPRRGRGRPPKPQRSTRQPGATALRQLVAANRSAGRLDAPYKGGPEGEPEVERERMTLAGMRLWPEEIEQARTMAQQEERSMAVFLRRVYLSGLAVYQAEQQALAQARERALERAQALALG